MRARIAKTRTWPVSARPHTFLRRLQVQEGTREGAAILQAQTVSPRVAALDQSADLLTQQLKDAQASGRATNGGHKWRRSWQLVVQPCNLPDPMGRRPLQEQSTRSCRGAVM
jgi:hypothetical protein